MKGGKGEGSSTKNPHAAPPSPPACAPPPSGVGERWGSHVHSGRRQGEAVPEKRPYAPPPIITPRIRLHLGLCAVGGGSLRRSKEGSVTSRLGWPARKEGVLLQLSATLPLFVTWHITFGRIYIFQSCPSFTIPSRCLD